MKRICLLIFSGVFMLNILSPLRAIALSEEQKKIFDSGIHYFNLAETDPANYCASVLAGNTNEEKVWSYFIRDMQFSPVQAAGIMGNIKQESGFNPHALNPGTTSPTPVSPSRAWGLVQWYGGRQTNLINYAEERGHTFGQNADADLQVQLDFLKKELEENVRPGVLEDIKASNDLTEVTKIFLERFETPCLPGSSECAHELNDIRLPDAVDILSRFGSGTPSNPGSSSSSAACSAGLEGVQCPANMEAHPNREGYFKMPVAPNDEYKLYSSESERYGSKQLVCVIYSVALAFNEAMQGRSKLRIGDLNAAGHASHNRGIAVDLSGEGELQVASHTADWKGTYDKDATILLGKLFADTGVLRNIWWCDPGDDSTEQIKAYAQTKGLEGDIKCISGHKDHFHVDIKHEYRLDFWEP